MVYEDNESGVGPSVHAFVALLDSQGFRYHVNGDCVKEDAATKHCLGGGTLRNVPATLEIPLHCTSG
jgi:hypothetical protein